VHEPGDLSRSACFKFISEHHREELRVSKVVLLGFHEPCVKMFKHAGEFKVPDLHGEL